MNAHLERPAQLQFCTQLSEFRGLKHELLQAIIEGTSVYQAGDRTSGMPFSAETSAHQPKSAAMTGTVLPKLLHQLK